MATLLGTANIQGAFTTTSEALVVTDDLNRVTTTAYRKPVAVHSGTSPADFRPLYINDVNLYLQSGYVDDDYLENNEFVEFIETASSPNNPGSSTLFCNFDFLEVDPLATVSNVEVRITLQSTVGGFTSFAPYGTQDELHYGKVKVSWNDDGSDDSTEITLTSKVTTNQLTTLSFTLEPHDPTDPAHISFWEPIGLGEHHMLKLTLEGVVNPPPPAFPQQSLNMQIYALEARVNYTGRTRFVTGFKSPATISGGTGSTALSSTGYGFAIPSGHVVDGVAVRFGADHPGSGNPGHGSFFNPGVPNVMHFVSGGSQVSTESMDLDADTRLMASPTLYDDVTRERHETLYHTVDEDNSNVAITTAEVNASDFGITTQFFPVSGSVGFDLEPSTLDINIAHVGPVISGDMTINTVSTVTATPSMTHGTTADEIDDFPTAVSLTAFGGFKLEGAPQTQASAFTTTVGTVGRIRSGFDIAMPAQFTVPNIDGSFVNRSGVAFSFPTATVTVSAAVSMTTGVDTINTAFTTTLGTTIGRIRAGFDIAIPSAFTTPAISDVLIIKEPLASQIFTTDTQTRTYVIPEDDRNITIPQQTRTHVIPADDRNITIPQQTRNIKVEGM